MSGGMLQDKATLDELKRLWSGAVDLTTTQTFPHRISATLSLQDSTISSDGLIASRVTCLRPDRSDVLCLSLFLR
jgi:hypothetical protein